MIWDKIIGTVLEVIDKAIPDPTEKAAAKLRLLELEQNGHLAVLKADTDALLAQLNVNAIEAASSDKFVSRWRPAFGWMGVAALGYTYLFRPVFPWLLTALGAPSVPDLPPVDMGELWPIIMGMLGIGGFRTYEKVKGVA